MVVTDYGLKDARS